MRTASASSRRSSWRKRPSWRRRRRRAPDVSASRTGGVRPVGPDPWLFPEDPFLESYVVRPGGATVFALGPDERMTVVDTRGSQAAEVSVLGADGRDDAGALDAKADAPATVIRGALADRNASLLAHELGSRGLDPADATAIRLF